MNNSDANSISEITRRNIFDELRVDKIKWAGRLSESAFLARLYNLEQLSSYDSRQPNAGGDIYLHREHFCDWPDDWIYDDVRFNLLKCHDIEFIKFLCEMLHPVVRRDSGETENLLELFNSSLLSDDWEIVATSRISNRPIFSGIRKFQNNDHSISALKNAIKDFSADYISQQITRMQSSIESDPELAIGTAKELIETCCKTILAEKGIILDGEPDLPKLMRATQKELNLLPESINESTKGVDAVKRVLSSFANITQGMAELRKFYGTGHGKAGKSTAIQPRHAKLAVGAATTLAIFLFETYKKSEDKK